MTRRLATILALTSALALCAAPAHAADPLLSGYAGPGGGEQVVLGGTTVKTPNKSSKGSSARQDPADAPLKAAPAPSSSVTSGESGGASSTLTRKPQRKKSSSSTSKDAGDDGTTTSITSTTTTAAAPLPGAPEVVAYPARAGEVSGLPISAAGILLVVLGLAAATLLGLGLRRFSGSDDPHDPQVPAR